MRNVLTTILLLIVIIGALNWLFYANDGHGLVNQFLGNKDGSMSKVEKITYMVIGISAIVLLVLKIACI